MYGKINYVFSAKVLQLGDQSITLKGWEGGERPVKFTTVNFE